MILGSAQMFVLFVVLIQALEFQGEHSGYGGTIKDMSHTSYISSRVLCMYPLS